MRKTTAVILAVLGIVLVLGGVFFLTQNDKAGGGGWSSRWSRKVAVSEGRTDPASSVTDFSIDKDGEYQISLCWVPQGKERSDLPKITPADTGFVTAVTILDAKGRSVFGQSAVALSIDSTIVLEKGQYSMAFHYLADREEYLDFAKTWLCGSASAELWAEGIDFAALQKDGAWTMDYELHVSPAGVWNGTATAVLLGTVIGLCLVVLMLAAVTKGKRMTSARYDERQELERGRGFRYAFFTLLLCCGLAVLIDVSGVFPWADLSVLCGFGVFASLAVYCVYCIWHECYFALNERRSAVLICFALIGLFNLGIGLSNLLSGRMIENGRITFHAINLMCAALFLILALTMLAKRIHDGKHSSSDPDEEETEA